MELFVPFWLCNESILLIYSLLVLLKYSELQIPSEIISEQIELKKIYTFRQKLIR